MKHLLLFLLVAMGSCILLPAQTVNRTKTAVQDSLTIPKDTVKDSLTQVITAEVNHALDKNPDLSFNLKERQKYTMTIIGIIGVFGMPALIVFIVFYFRHKNLKAKYEIAVKALEMGKEVPKNLSENSKEISNTFTKGINNTFIGIGMGIFFWAVTGQFGIGCIGFMIMFIGIGQLIIYRVLHSKNSKKDILSDKDCEHTDTISNEK